jgi:site-specific DNA recombinase
MTDSKIAAIYVRVSTTDQADKGYSLPTQIEACMALAQREGYTVPAAHIFPEDYTGTSLRRPGLTAVRDLVAQRLVQGVVVYDTDRLARKLAHQLLLTDEFEQAGVCLHSVTMPYGAKTPEQHLLANVKGIIAEYERAKILERTARGRQGRAKAGHVPYGRRTLGYVYVKHASKGAHYEVHPEEAALVQRIFRLCVEDGHSVYAIAALLTREGALTSLGRQVWHTSTIASILHNTAYIGTMYDGKTQRLPGRSNPDKKTRSRHVPREEWIPIAVPPLVDLATFEVAVAQLQHNKRQAKRNRKHEYLLVNGRLRCGQCGGAMTGGAKRATRYYVCNRRRFQDADGSHTKRSVQALTLEPLVWQAVERVLRNPQLIAEEVARQRDGTSRQQGALARERQHYEKQLHQCDKDLKRWEAAYLAEAIDVADFKGKKAEVDARRGSVERELMRLEEEQRQLEAAALETTTLIDYCRQVAQSLRQLDPEEQRLALEALNITVTWYPDKPFDIRGSIPVAIASNASACNVHPQI